MHKLSSLDPLLKIKNKKRGGGGVTSHPFHIGGGHVALNLQISCLKLEVHLENTPWLDFHHILHRLSLSGPICLSKIFKKRGHHSCCPYRWSESDKQCNCKWKCNFAGRHLYGWDDWCPPPPLFIFDFKADLIMIAYAMCYGFLTLGYF